MGNLIDKDAAIEAMLQLERDDEESYGARIPEGFDGARAVEAIDKLPVVEPLADAEQRIFLAAMERESKVCEEIDSETVREAYEVSLTKICKEIKRKVMGALWT